MSNGETDEINSGFRTILAGLADILTPYTDLNESTEVTNTYEHDNSENRNVEPEVELVTDQAVEMTVQTDSTNLEEYNNIASMFNWESNGEESEPTAGEITDRSNSLLNESQNLLETVSTEQINEPSSSTHHHYHHHHYYPPYDYQNVPVPFYPPAPHTFYGPNCAPFSAPGSVNTMHRFSNPQSYSSNFPTNTAIHYGAVPVTYGCSACEYNIVNPYLSASENNRVIRVNVGSNMYTVVLHPEMPHAPFCFFRDQSSRNLTLIPHQSSFTSNDPNTQIIQTFEQRRNIHHISITQFNNSSNSPIPYVQIMSNGDTQNRINITANTNMAVNDSTNWSTIQIPSTYNRAPGSERELRWNLRNRSSTDSTSQRFDHVNIPYQHGQSHESTAPIPIFPCSSLNCPCTNSSSAPTGSRRRVNNARQSAGRRSTDGFVQASRSFPTDHSIQMNQNHYRNQESFRGVSQRIRFHRYNDNSSRAIEDAITRYATPDAIQNFTVRYTYKMVATIKLDFTNGWEICPICIEQFNDSDDVRRLPCLHLYHTECIDRWLSENARCPVCRINITIAQANPHIQKIDEGDCMAN